MTGWGDALIDKAEQYATRAHEGQQRKFSGEPYVNHCIRVAKAVKANGATAVVIAAAMLHDTVEDTRVTLSDIAKEFGEDVAHLVGLLTHEPGKTYRDYLLGLIPDPNAWIVKWCDLLDNLSTMPRGHRMAWKYLTALDTLLRETDDHGKPVVDGTSKDAVESTPNKGK